MEVIEIFWRDHHRLIDKKQPIRKYLIYSKLIQYCKSITLAPVGLNTIHLHTSTLAPDVVCSAEDDVFAINVPWTEDLDLLKKNIVDDITGYLLILSPNRSTNYWRMAYETNNERLRPLVERLNANAKATSFKNTIMAHFTVKCITPYKGQKETLPSATPQQEDYSKSNIVFKKGINGREIDMNLLREWLYINCVKYIKHKYDWLAPLLFFDYHQLLNKDDSKSWAEQMNKWFPDTKIKCTQDQLNCYRRGFFQDDNFKYDDWLNGNVPVSPDYSFKKDQIKDGFDNLYSISNNWLKANFELSKLYKKL